MSGDWISYNPVMTSIFTKVAIKISGTVVYFYDPQYGCMLNRRSWWHSVSCPAVSHQHAHFDSELRRRYTVRTVFGLSLFTTLLALRRPRFTQLRQQFVQSRLFYGSSIVGIYCSWPLIRYKFLINVLSSSVYDWIRPMIQSLSLFCDSQCTMFKRGRLHYISPVHKTM